MALSRKDWLRATNLEEGGYGKGDRGRIVRFRPRAAHFRARLANDDVSGRGWGPGRRLSVLALVMAILVMMVALIDAFRLFP